MKRRIVILCRSMILYGIFLACCYLTVQQYKTSHQLTTTAGDGGISSSSSQKYPFGSAFLTTTTTDGGGAESHQQKHHHAANPNPDEKEKQQHKIIKKKKPPLSTLSLTTTPRIGKNGMLLNNPWQQRLSLQGGQQPGQGEEGYAPTGGELPTSPTFSTLYHKKMWYTIDNGTCLVDHNNTSSNPVYEWQLRAPYVILLGAMKAGTQALTSYLWQHPRFIQKDFGYEMHFFDQSDFIRNATGIPCRINQESYAKRFWTSHKKFLLIESMRRRQVNNSTTVSFNGSTIINNKSNNTRKLLSSSVELLLSSYYYAMDSSPYYLLASDRIPDAILCVVPWSKWLIVLRNPIQRVESHFRHLHQVRYDNNKRMVDWNIWIQDDIRLLQQAGVLLPSHVSYIFDNNNATSLQQQVTLIQDELNAFAGSNQEMLAWKRYNRSPSSQQIVGRGLYAIQIGHYIAALKRHYWYQHNNATTVDNDNDDNDDDNDNDDDDDDNDDDEFQQVLREKLLVLTSEELATHTQNVYNRVLEFLQLPKHVLLDTSKVHASNITKLPNVPMPHYLRLQLQRLYEPYNQRLYQILKWNNNVWQ